MKAADYKPPHGGFPRARRHRPRRALPIGGGGGVVINTVAPPPQVGFGPGHLHEMYSEGYRDGRDGRRPRA